MAAFITYGSIMILLACCCVLRLCIYDAKIREQSMEKELLFYKNLAEASVDNFDKREATYNSSKSLFESKCAEMRRTIEKYQEYQLEVECEMDDIYELLKEKLQRLREKGSDLREREKKAKQQ